MLLIRACVTNLHLKAKIINVIVCSPTSVFIILHISTHTRKCTHILRCVSCQCEIALIDGSGSWWSKGAETIQVYRTKGMTTCTLN